MIIGNSLAGVLGGGSNSGYTTPAGKSTSGNTAPSAPDAANSQDSSRTGGRAAQPDVRQSGADLGGAIDLHQTARIMALVASMRQVDDVSAYSLFGRNEGETDEYRHVVSAYKNASE
jgi:hypothetical protein